MLKYSTPILLIAWRRPEQVLEVIKEIRKVQAEFIYVAVDGIREGSEYSAERENILATKKLIEKELDWQCEVKYLFRDKNLGCGKSVSSAITWFFEHVEEGIILEDDCLPSDEFFKFCSFALEKYRHRKDIMHIGGVSYHSEFDSKYYDYRFSRYGHIWGWATWKRAWSHYNLHITDSDEEIKRNVTKLNSRTQENYWLDLFIKQRDQPIDTWDYSWQYIIWKLDGYCIYPKFSMVKNIGFDSNATHTTTLPRLMPTCNSKNLQILTFRSYWLFNYTFINGYYDYINFMRAFKTKDVNAAEIKNIIKYLIFRRI